MVRVEVARPNPECPSDPMLTLLALEACSFSLNESIGGGGRDAVYPCVLATCLNAQICGGVPVPDFSLALEDRPNESIGVAGTR